MPDLQVNIAVENYGHPPFLNWTRNRVSTNQFVQASISGSLVNGPSLFSAGRMTADGEVANITDMTELYVMINLATANGADLSGRNMAVKWDGGAAVTGFSGASNLENISADIPNKRVTFTIKGGSSYNVWLRFLIDDSLVVDPTTEGAPTNIRAFEVSKETALDAGDILDPDWVAEIAPYSCTRWMDAGATNGSTATNYADIASLSFRYWGKTYSADGMKNGWPPEVYAEIANATQKPIWVTLPHLLTDAAVTSYLTALNNNIDFDIPGMLVYIEYTNEPWNSQFAQYAYMVSQASGSGWATYPQDWYGYRAAQVMEIARTVFGTDSGTKWSGVLGSQATNSFQTTRALVGVNYYIDNDSPPAGTTVAKLFSDVAIAPYFGPGISSTQTGSGVTWLAWAQAGQQTFTTNMYNALKFGAASASEYNDLDKLRTAWQSHYTSAQAEGLGLICYEGGTHMILTAAVADNLNGETNGALMIERVIGFSESKECAQLLYDMFVQFEADTGGMVSQFVLTGPHTKNGSWGANQKFGEITERKNVIDAYVKGYSYSQGRRAIRMTMDAS